MKLNYAADVVRLKNSGKSRAAIMEELNLSIGQVNGALFRAQQRGDTVISSRAAETFVHQSGDGAAALAEARQHTREFRKNTAARDEAIRRLYGTEPDKLKILPKINALDGPPVTWPEIMWRASKIGVARYKPPAPAAPAAAQAFPWPGIDFRTKRRPKTPAIPSAKAAFAGKLQVSTTARCCWPMWRDRERPDGWIDTKFCDAPAAVVQRRDGDDRTMQYCPLHCGIAFINWPVRHHQGAAPSGTAARHR